MISKNRQLLFDIGVVTSYLALSVWLISIIHGFGTTEFAYTMLTGLSGITTGWLVGLLAAPFSEKEQNRFSQLKTTIISFISGYLISKVEPLIKYVTTDINIIKEPTIGIRILIYFTSGAFAFIYMYSYRKYYLKQEDIIFEEK